MTFEKHLRSVSIAASQRLGLRKSWRVSHDRSLRGRGFRVFVLPVLEYCSAVWCLAADTQIILLDRQLYYYGWSSVSPVGVGWRSLSPIGVGWTPVTFEGVGWSPVTPEIVG